MLLSLLGACVYVYREIDDSIRTATLAPREGPRGGQISYNAKSKRFGKRKGGVYGLKFMV